MASSVFEAVARAKEFFESDFWRGPKPTPETIYLVARVADERLFRVCARDVQTMPHYDANRHCANKIAQFLPTI